MDLNDLHKKAVEGDSRSETVLFSELTDRFNRFARLKLGDPETGQEVTQEALVIVAEQFRTLEVRFSFTAWAYRVLENKIMQRYRVLKNKAAREAPLEAVASRQGVPPIASGIKRRLKECLKSVLKNYPRYARILNLHYQGYTVAEICSKMDVSRNNAYLLLSRGRSMLRECVERGQ